MLIGDPACWDAQTRSTTGMLAAVLAVQLRHTGDLAFLSERETVTQALIEASPDAVLVVAFNPAAEKLYGWRREDVLGKEMPGMLIPERNRPRFMAGTKASSPAVTPVSSPAG